MVAEFIKAQVKRNREIVAYGSFGRRHAAYIEPDTRKDASAARMTYGGGLMLVRDDNTLAYGDGDGGGNRERHEAYTVHVGGGQGAGGMGKRFALTPRLHITLFGGVGGGGGGVAVTDNETHDAVYGAGGANILSLKSGIAIDYRIGGRIGFIIGVRIGHQLPLLKFTSKGYRGSGLTVRLIYGLSLMQNPISR